MLEPWKKFFASAPDQPAERTIYFHEDDYCQIELLPVSARTHCMTQMGIIDNFTTMHDDGGMGFTGIYVRPDAPHALTELCLTTSAFSEALKRHFPAYDSVFTGYRSHREECKSTLAWGDDSWTIFADHNADIIQHAWLDLRDLNADAVTRIVCALRDLPWSESILIADWSWSLVAMLSDIGSLNEYFQQRIGNG
jgi:hypothetical protein